MFSGKFQKGPVKEIKLSKEQYELIKREMVIENKKYNEIMNDIIAFYFKNHWLKQINFLDCLEVDLFFCHFVIKLFFTS